MWTDDEMPLPGTVLCAADLADGQARVVPYGGGRLPKEVVVVRDGDAIKAYLNRCAHQALPLNVGRQVRTAEDRLLCDHHHAEFRFADGLCVDGVCVAQSLSPVPVAVRDGQVVVATAGGFARGPAAPPL